NAERRDQPGPGKFTSRQDEGDADAGQEAHVHVVARERRQYRVAVPDVGDDAGQPHAEYAESQPAVQDQHAEQQVKEHFEYQRPGDAEQHLAFRVGNQRDRAYDDVRIAFVADAEAGHQEIHRDDHGQHNPVGRINTAEALPEVGSNGARVADVLRV